MKVYIVTAGEYSDYHIDAVFTDKNMANQYANLDSDRNVEEYETDIESVEADPNKLIYRVHYNFEENKIESLCLTSGYKKEDDWVNDITFNDFVFYVSPHETLNDSIRKFGMHSDWLLKIAQDRFCMYCDAHETSRQIILTQKKKRDEEFYQKYPMYRTSIDTAGPNMHDPEFNPYWFADKRMTNVMKKYAEEHGSFPDEIVLKQLYNEQVEEVKRQHEHDELR